MYLTKLICQRFLNYDKIQREKNLFEEMDKQHKRKLNRYVGAGPRTQRYPSSSQASITVHKIDKKPIKKEIIIIDGQPLITNFFIPKQLKR